MAQTTFNVNMDENLKRRFDAICMEFGMNSATAINVFASAVVQKRKIPFEIEAPTPYITAEQALKVVREMREDARRNGAADLSLEEINEEIRKARNGEGE